MRPKRFELLTLWFVARYSIQLSYGRIIKQDSIFFITSEIGFVCCCYPKLGRGYWDRTSDNRVKVCGVAATLTPIILLVWVGGFEPPASEFQAPPSTKLTIYPVKNLPYRNTLASQVPWDGLFTVRSMFLYGRSSGTRTHNSRIKSPIL